MLELVDVIAGLDDMAMMGQTDFWWLRVDLNHHPSIMSAVSCQNRSIAQ